MARIRPAAYVSITKPEYNMDRATALKLFRFDVMMDIARDIRIAKRQGAPESVQDLINEMTSNPVTREQLAHQLGVA